MGPRLSDSPETGQHEHVVEGLRHPGSNPGLKLGRLASSWVSDTQNLQQNSTAPCPAGGLRGHAVQTTRGRTWYIANSYKHYKKQKAKGKKQNSSSAQAHGSGPPHTDAKKRNNNPMPQQKCNGCRLVRHGGRKVLDDDGPHMMIGRKASGKELIN